MTHYHHWLGINIIDVSCVEDPDDSAFDCRMENLRQHRSATMSSRTYTGLQALRSKYGCWRAQRRTINFWLGCDSPLSPLRLFLLQTSDNAREQSDGAKNFRSIQAQPQKRAANLALAVVDLAGCENTSALNGLLGCISSSKYGNRIPELLISECSPWGASK